MIPERPRHYKITNNPLPILPSENCPVCGGKSETERHPVQPNLVFCVNQDCPECHKTYFYEQWQEMASANARAK